MKIIHTADWHLGKHLNDYSLLTDQKVFLDELLHAVSTNPPDAVVIAGDIYDRSVPSAEAVALLDHTLQTLVLELHIPTLLLAGNHDSADRLQFGSGMLGKSGLYISGKQPTTVTLYGDIGEVDVHLLPYMDLHQLRARTPEHPPHTLQEGMAQVLTELRQRFVPGRRNLLAAHGFFAVGCGQAADESVGGSELILLNADGFDHILLGHLHGARSAGAQARYSGSPLKYSVDEANQPKSWDEISLTYDDVTVRQHPIHPMRDLRVLEGCFADLLAGPSSDDYLSLHLTDEQPIPDAALQLKSVYPHLLELHWTGFSFQSPNSLPDQKDLKQENLPSLFADFYEQLTARPLSDVQRTILKELEVDA